MLGKYSIGGERVKSYALATQSLFNISLVCLWWYSQKFIVA